MRSIRGAAFLAVTFGASVSAAGCGSHHGAFTSSSAEFAPLDRAKRDAGVKTESVADKTKWTVVRTGTRTQPDYGAAKFDPLYILSVPLSLLWQGARHLVVTDIDRLPRPRFETHVVYAKDDAGKSPSALTDADTFEVWVQYVAIDSFTGGRLRDAWGGSGGQVSIQTSMNALSDRGMLLRDDTKFVVEQDVKRRVALIAVAKGTAKGREYTKKVEDKAKEMLEKAKDLQIDLDHIKQYVAKVQAAGGDREGELEKGRKAVIEAASKWVTEHVNGDEERAFAKQMADSLVNAVFDEIKSHLPDRDVDDAAKWVERVAKEAERHIGQASAVLDFLGRYGVDENGIYESAKIVVGLADADRLSTMEFENVKPSLLQFPGEAGGGTAATLIGDECIACGTPVVNEQNVEGATDAFRATQRETAVDSKPGAASSNDDIVVTPRNLVYRGSLKDLSRTMDGVRGFSLSFLMIDRGDDRVVRTLRALQQYADSRGMTIGGGGTQIEVSAIIDGLAVLAQRIAEDKVELRAIDLRFVTARPAPGSTPGTELFALRPCTVLISRNLDGTDFGAVAEVVIRKVAGDAPKQP